MRRGGREEEEKEGGSTSNQKSKPIPCQIKDSLEGYASQTAVSLSISMNNFDHPQNRIECVYAPGENQIGARTIQNKKQRHQKKQWRIKSDVRSGAALAHLFEVT